MRLILTLCILITASAVVGQKKKKGKTTTPPPAPEQVYNGFISFGYNEKQDKVTLRISRLNEEFLYIGALSAGVGSNDIGLDRGQLGQEHVVKFVKAGNKILLIEPNYGYRAISDNPDEVKAVEEAFAQSVLWGFKIDKEVNGTYHVDATNFLIRDVHGVSARLASTKQGSYKLDKSRSAMYMANTKNFPDNTEFDVTLTFTGKAQGDWVRSVTPSPSSITVRQHHSFIKLPDDQYKPRVFDSRAGFFGISYMDYATPISEPIRKRFISRHRLEKKDPNAAVSEAKEPIIYYLDRGAPEPIRSALLDGAKWWNQAFEAAGYKDAFQVKLLPADADPLDARYNVIQWVHRSTRGWSYGGSITDPRTGEIIKGHVTLGSLRVRQDFLIAEGLLAPYGEGNSIPAAMQEMALARLRQLSAHEVGHTLGLAHSYASSTEGRASVMDYPHPLVELQNGKITLDNAYDDKIGAWDKVSIAYGYQDFPEGQDMAQGLETIIQNGLKQGLTFLSDQDARPRGGAHPYAHLWDNGAKAYDELNRVIEIRAVALNNFGPNNIRPGSQYATLEEVLVPIYFFHRYQLEGAVKLIGGLDYRYAKKGDGQPITSYIDKSEQMKALDAVMNTVKPEALALPEAVMASIPPRALGYQRSNELVKIRTGLTFDALGAAETLADMAFSLTLHPARAGRLVEYSSRNPEQPGLGEVFDKMINSTWKTASQSGYSGALQRTTQDALLSNMMALAGHAQSSEQVKAMTSFKINQLRKWLVAREKVTNSEALKAHYLHAINKINRFQKNPEKFKIKKSLAPPAGSPIGLDMEYCNH